MPGQAFPGIDVVVRTVWPGAPIEEVDAEKVSHRRNAEHWRLRYADDSMIVRLTTREASASRIIAALNALEGESFAPVMMMSIRTGDGAFAIAMEDLWDQAPTTADRSMLPALVETIKRLHQHQLFHDAVKQVGRAEGEDSSLGWAEEEWNRLQFMAVHDDRLGSAARWMDTARKCAPLLNQARAIMVHSHGDLHRGNWRVTPRGPALIDWEEIRFWPLASELADFIVFGDVDPGTALGLYGTPDSYTKCARRAAAICALSFYLYWLRTDLDGTDPRPDSLARARIACERLF